MNLKHGTLLALAVCAPWLALTAAAGADRWSVGLAVSPFGWLSLQGVHLLAMLPLAAMTGSLLQARITACVGDQQDSFLRLAWLLLALVGLWLTLTQTAFVDAWLASVSAGFAQRFVVRCLWSFALQLPWCLLAAATGANRAAGPAHAFTWLGGAAVLGLATALPWTYMLQLEREQSTLAADYLTRGKFAAAQLAVLGLCDLGSVQVINGQRPGQIARELARRTADYLAGTVEPLGDHVTPAERIARAQLHAQYGQIEAARAEVAVLAEKQFEAALLIAATWQEEGEFGESTRHYLRARQLAEQAETSAAAIRALDGLAFNARAEGRYEEATAYYESGLRQFPAAAAHFHFQLGRQHQLGGRPWLAAEHFEQAAVLDAAQYGRAADEQLAQMRLMTPACLPVGWRLGGAR